jgi:hypothetical protein
MKEMPYQIPFSIKIVAAYESKYIQKTIRISTTWWQIYPKIALRKFLDCEFNS